MGRYASDPIKDQNVLKFRVLSWGTPHLHTKVTPDPYGVTLWGLGHGD